MSEQNLINQGIQLIRAGNIPTAKSLFEKIVSAYPRSADAFYYLGFIAAQSGNLPGAVLSFEKAIKLRSDHIQAITSLGSLYGQVGQLDKAVEHYRGVIDKGVERADILFQYGCALVAKSQSNEAKPVFQKSIAADGAYLQPYLALARLYQAEEDHSERAKIFEKAYLKGLKHSLVFNGYYNALVSIGELEKASAIAKEGLKLDPTDIALLYNYSRADASICDDACEKRLSSLDWNKRPQEDFANAQFVLARCAKNRKDYETEIETLLKGHSLFLQNSRFSLEKSYYIDKLPKFISASKPDLEPISDSADYRPIFIVGVPRCGSTLVESILCSGQDAIKKAEECSVIEYAVIHSNMLADERAFYSELKQGYKRFDIDLGSDVFTDKSLENVFYVDSILKLFPNAKIVYCQRSPLASLVSILQNNLNALSWAHDMGSILSYFDLVQESAALWKSKFPDQVYTLEYEELVQHPETVSKAMFEFCGLEWDASCLDFYKTKSTSTTASNVQIRAGINTSALSKEDRYKPYLKEYTGRYEWLDRELGA